MDYKKSVKEVAASASRAFEAIISRPKVHGGLPYEIFCKLYESLVWPLVDYSAPVWGNVQYNCINSVQTGICRWFVGVGKLKN